MARLTTLPSLQIIKGYKGTIDYYMHRGIPCARAWPRPPAGPRSPASQVTAAAFAVIAAAAPSIQPSVRLALVALAVSNTLVWRDYLVRAYFGRLLEPMLVEAVRSDGTEIASQATLQSVLNRLDVLLSTRALEAGGNLAAILAQLDVDLSTRAVESGGNLAAILARLDVDLSTRAIESGGNLAAILNMMPSPLFGISDVYNERATNTSHPAGDVVLTLATVPAGEIWVIYSATAFNASGASTQITIYATAGGTTMPHARELAPPQNKICTLPGSVFLEAGDTLSAEFQGTALNDVLILSSSGYKMTI